MLPIATTIIRTAATMALAQGIVRTAPAVYARARKLALDTTRKIKMRQRTRRINKKFNTQPQPDLTNRPVAKVNGQRVITVAPVPFQEEVAS